MIGNAPHWSDPRYARWLLPMGLVAGLLLPAVGLIIQPWIPWLISLQLFVACLRVDWNFASVKAVLAPSIAWVLVFQCVLASVAAIALAGLEMDLAWRIPILFVLAAAPLTGSPNIVSMLGGPPQIPLATLILGTALLPLTSLPMLWTVAAQASEIDLLSTVARLLITITVAVVAAYIVRRFAFTDNHSSTRASALDLIAALLLAIVVMGLLSGFHAESVTTFTVIAMLTFVVLLNVGMHLVGVAYAQVTNAKTKAIAMTTVSAGFMAANRNVALLLTALPMAALEPHLLFLACYQVPMYLTPVVAGWFYKDKL